MCVCVCVSQMTTSRLEVPFFVKSVVQFERDYPKGSSSRFKMERQVGYVS